MHSPHERLQPDEAYTLSVEGSSDSEGLEISRLTSLKEIRRSFPVPEHFAFGVPLHLEGELLASEYQPLVLLNTDEVRVAKLEIRPSNVELLQRKLNEAKAELVETQRQSANMLAAAHSEHDKELARVQRSNAALVQKLGLESATLRNELAKLRANVEALKAEATHLLKSGLQQVESARSRQHKDSASASSAQASEVQALRDEVRELRDAASAHRAHTSEVQALRNELRAMHQAHEGELRSAESRFLAMEERYRVQESLMRQELRQHQQQVRSSAPAASSRTVFSDYMRANQLRRDCDFLQEAAKDFYARPEFPSTREAFMSALMRLMTTANAAADGGSTGPTSYTGSSLGDDARSTLASAPAPAANVAASLVRSASMSHAMGSSPNGRPSVQESPLKRSASRGSSSLSKLAASPMLRPPGHSSGSLLPQVAPSPSRRLV